MSFVITADTMQENDYVTQRYHRTQHCERKHVTERKSPNHCKQRQSRLHTISNQCAVIKTLYKKNDIPAHVNLMHVKFKLQRTYHELSRSSDT